MGITDKFGRVVNGAVQYAPKPLVINGQRMWTNNATIYHQNGWFTVRRTPMPTKEGFYYTEYWEEDEEGYEVVQRWREHEIVEPEPSEIDMLTERVGMIDEVITALMEDIIPDLCAVEDDE